jgi:oligosaccharide repeat unit polymerase
MWNKILNPFVIYTCTWSLVLYLISLQLTININRLEFNGLLIIYVNLITSALIYGVFYLFYGKKKNGNLKPSVGQYNLSYKFANRSFYVFLSLTILDVIYSGGVPLLWIFIGGSKGYAHLGIPSIKGLQYTLYIFSFTVYVYLLKLNKFKHWKFKISIMTILPFLMLARGLMMYAIFHGFYIYIYDKKIKLKQFRNIFIFILGLIMIFGIIGDVRGEYANPFGPLINTKGNNPLQKLPSGFTWFYIYITANFNNILLTIGTFEPSYNVLGPFYNVVPGFLKQIVFTPSGKGNPLITNNSLNVASFYALYVRSFGVIGGIVGGILMQITATYYYFKTRTYNIGYLYGYSIIFTCMIFSVFFDAFMTVSSIFGILLSLYLANKLKGK